MEDAFKAYIQAKLGNEGGIYGFATCRTWSRRMFEAAPGALINPPPAAALFSWRYSGFWRGRHASWKIQNRHPDFWITFQYLLIKSAIFHLPMKNMIVFILFLSPLFCGIALMIISHPTGLGHLGLASVALLIAHMSGRIFLSSSVSKKDFFLTWFFSSFVTLLVDVYLSFVIFVFHDISLIIFSISFIFFSLFVFLGPLFISDAESNLNRYLPFR